MTDEDRRRKRLISLWARSPYWTIEEGVSLICNLDPKELEGRRTSGIIWPGLGAPSDAGQVWKLAHRAVEVGSLAETPAPIVFMKWARTIGVEFHSDWWAAVVETEEPAETKLELPPPAAPVLDLKTREQETLLKMVAGMAMAYYGWKPDVLRSEATAVIAGDLDRMGVPLDPDTIRKWLRKSAELLPRADP